MSPIVEVAASFAFGLGVTPPPTHASHPRTSALVQCLAAAFCQAPPGAERKSTTLCEAPPAKKVLAQRQRVRNLPGRRRNYGCCLPEKTQLHPSSPEHRDRVVKVMDWKSIHGALPAGARIPSMSLSLRERIVAAGRAELSAEIADQTTGPGLARSSPAGISSISTGRAGRFRLLAALAPTPTHACKSRSDSRGRAI